MRKRCAWPPEVKAMTDIPYISPQQRLADSRQAIVRHMSHDAPGGDSAHESHSASNPQAAASDGAWNLIKQTATAWWQGHPAHLALDIAKPMIQTYAEEKPLQLLGISAGIGAAAAVLRPWRLISLTGVLLAALKSSEMSSVIRTLLSSVRTQDKLL